jgi:PAS domain S-box-containing protein
MGNPALERRQRAWERFFATGEIEADDVSDVIARSWRRCREAGLDPQAPKVPVRQNQDELADTVRRNGPYIEAALPFMRFLESAVRGSGYILVLTDSAGIVLEVFGDDDVISRARQNNYVPGCCRSEDEVGTNSIGLAMVERKPVQLSGSEHYNVRHHSWTCASAPVFSVAGSFLGTVTLSGQSTNSHPHTLGMVISAADAIQNRLREQRLENEKWESEKLTQSLLKSMSDAIVTINCAGEIVYVNKPAEVLVGLSERDLSGRRVTSLLSAPQFSDLLRSQSDIAPFEAALEIDGRRSYVVIKPFVVRENEGVLGAILAMSRRREFLKNVRGMSGFTARYTLDDIVGRNNGLRRQIELAATVARQNSRVLVTGETGTGKELIAQGIHNASARASGPFVAINCAAIPRELIESELLGYKDGAFTGARRGGQVGKLELADGGTLFLDEISQMPIDMQAKVLRVLQDGIVTRLGDTKPVVVDVRIIAATNEDLFEKSQVGEFRSDLYFRLSVVEIALPPLRDRGGDIDLLVDAILQRLRERLGQPHLTIDGEALACLRAYTWPGNIRELENMLETAAIMSDGRSIGAAALPPRIVRHGQSPAASDRGTNNRREPEGTVLRSAPAQDLTRRIAAETTSSIRDLEAEAILHALREHNCNISKVSRSLGISRSTVYRKMREIGVNRTFSVN